MKPITQREREILRIKPDAEVYVTDEHPDSLPTYNCAGSVLELRWKFTPEMGKDATAIDFLLRIGLRPQDPAALEKKIAVYRGKNLGLWHVAKHIGCGWYESKCREGLRIVHRADCFLDDDDGYGAVESFWEFDGEEAKSKLEQALLEDLESRCGGSAAEKRAKAQAWRREIQQVFDSKPPA